MESEAKILLDDAIDFCQRDGRDDRLVQMLSQARAVELTDDRLAIEAPSRFAISYLERNRELVEGYLMEIAFAPIALEVRPPESAAGDRSARTRAASIQAPVMTPPAATPQADTAPMPVQPAPVAAPAAAIPARAQAATTPRPTAPSPLPRPQQAGDRPAEGGIRVKSTINPAELAEMMGRMGGATPATPAALHGAASPVATAGVVEPKLEPDYPQTPINSKFTFANFVYGDENKHAYHSAQRFAAFADEPGQAGSLFIYGDSGLGKTHLLLAIQNYLAENKPHIRVKYSNSQAYIDDFINEIQRQKTEGRTILREYHDADVLIIDDIQNIIGKQASIDYFFRLMEEFISQNKKIAIASDRAPKKLALDERMTSRFNAGMLCLVSEPGFEMKYTILKRYYESITRPDDDMQLNYDASLLSAFKPNEGRLTDEQLRHMAEISGNNIRELESFCERCTNLSFEREQAGGELTAEDIERVADEYFDTQHKVIHIDTIQSVIEEFYHVSHEELIGPKRQRDIAFARHVAIYLSNSLCDLSSKAIGEEFGGRDHSTVINSLKVVESKMKEDRRICEDLQQLKNKITLRS